MADSYKLCKEHELVENWKAHTWQHLVTSVDGDVYAEFYDCIPITTLETNSDFVTKFSGQAEDFGTGAHRDSQTGKPRYDLIPAKPLKRVADLYTRGGKVHGDKNWLNGIPNSRSMASLLRHAQDYRLGDRSEDHLAAICWNAMAIMQFEGGKFDDFDNWEKPE